MDLFTQIVLILFIVNLGAIFIVTSAWSDKEINWFRFFLAGKYIFGDFSKYIRKDRRRIYSILNYTALALFLIFIIYLIISVASKLQ